MQLSSRSMAVAFGGLVALGAVTARVAATAAVGMTSIHEFDGSETKMASTITVTNTNDSGDGSLRAAVETVGEFETIDFDLAGCPCEITLTTGEIVIERSLTIAGPGADMLTISGGNLDRIFRITSPIRWNFVWLSGLSLNQGNADLGGAIKNEGGRVTLTDSAVVGNSAHSSGGGIYNAGVLFVTGSALWSNKAGEPGGNASGGGIYNAGLGVLYVTNSTIAFNRADAESEGFGGGIYNQGTLTLTNATLTTNMATGDSQSFGGGIYNASRAVAKNTIVAENEVVGSPLSGGPDVSGLFESQGYNLIGKTNGGAGFAQTSDQTGTLASPLDPMLGDLQFNGGPTPTRALLEGSPAIDRGSAANDPDTSLAIVTDQRGLLRPGDNLLISNAPGGNGSDIGAFEVDATPPVISANVSGAPGSNGWYVGDVQLSWVIVDGESRVTSEIGCDSQTISTDTSGITLTCTATSAGGAESQSVTIKRDTGAPTLSPTVSPNPVSLNGAATATANASDPLSGVTSQSCDAVDTSTPGTHSVACSATDHAGNVANASTSYEVVSGYNFAGFFQPVDNLPTLNVAIAGSSIPLKFSLGGNQGLAIFAAGYPASSPIPCDAAEPGAVIEETINAGGSSLTYNAVTDQYSYVWKTDQAWKGSCRMLVVGLKDESQHLARFRFK